MAGIEDILARLQSPPQGTGDQTGTASGEAVSVDDQGIKWPTTLTDPNFVPQAQPAQSHAGGIADDFDRVYAKTQKQDGPRPVMYGGLTEQEVKQGIKDGTVERPNMLVSALTGLQDTLTLGTDSYINAIGPTVIDYLTTDLSSDEIGSRYTQHWQNEEAFKRVASYSNPMSAAVGGMAGDVVAGVALGGGMVQAGAKVMPSATKYLMNKATGRTAIAAATAGIQSGVYSINKTGDLKEAAYDAAIAAVAGGAFGGLFEGGQAAYRRIKGIRPTDVLFQDTGKELLDTINKAREIDGLPSLTASQVQKEVEALGPGATVIDYLPQTLRNTAKKLLTNDDASDMAVKTRNLIATRNDLAAELSSDDNLLSGLLFTKGSRSQTQFDADIAKAYENLSPQITDILKANKGTTFSIKEVSAAAKAALGNDPRASSIGKSEIQSYIDKTLKQFQVLSTTKGKSPKWGTVKIVPKEINASQMYELIKDLGDQINVASNKIASGGSSVNNSLTKADQRDLVAVRSLFTEMFHGKVPEMVPISRTYATLGDAKRAYQAGMDFASDTFPDTALAEGFFANTQRSTTELMAFGEAVKNSLYRQIMKKSKVETGKGVGQVMEEMLVNSSDMVTRLKAVFGDSAVDDMMKSLKPKITMAATADTLKAAARLDTKPAVNQPVSGIINNLIDSAIAGSTSQGSAFGAGRRLANQVVPQKAMGAIKGQAAIKDSLLASTGDEAAKVWGGLQKLMDTVITPSSASSLQKSLISGGAAANLANRFTNPGSQP